MFIEIASVQSFVSSQRLGVMFCVRNCPLGNSHSHSSVRPWMSPWAEAVGLFSLGKRGWSGTNHTFCCPWKLQGPWSQLCRVSTGKGPQTLGAARKFSPKLKKTHFFPLQSCSFLCRFQVSILGDLQMSAGEDPEQPDLALGLPCCDRW